MGTSTLSGHGLRSSALRAAVRLEVVTLVWMVIEAATSIAAGLLAGSLLLIAFGVDSVIELISAVVLYHRLKKEAADQLNKAESEALEQKASRIGGWLLYALAVYVIFQAAYGLWQRKAAESSFLGIAVAVVAALGMPLLAKAKLRLAAKIESSALRADAMETLTCGYLAWMVLLGLIANSFLHWWWLDSAASVMIVPYLLREAREAVRGECCSD